MNNIEWISVKDRLPESHDIIKVKNENGDEIKAYFHADQMSWLYFYTKEKLSHFQCKNSLKFLHDVTHWMSL
jgi:flagellin-specific chaperone FliS